MQEFYKDNCAYWKDKIYYWVKYVDECVCFNSMMYADAPSELIIRGRKI